MRTELDGWYIDLNVEFNCDMNRPPTMPTNRMPNAGCRDQVKTRREGTAKTVPLIETMKYYGSDGQLTFAQTKEVIELSRATLEVLCLIFEGYTSNKQLSFTAHLQCFDDVWHEPGKPSDKRTNIPSRRWITKRPGSLLVGIVQFNNKQDDRSFGFPQTTPNREHH
jgi:hypothetical protein